MPLYRICITFSACDPTRPPILFLKVYGEIYYGFWFEIDGIKLYGRLLCLIKPYMGKVHGSLSISAAMFATSGSMRKSHSPLRWYYVRRS